MGERQTEDDKGELQRTSAVVAGVASDARDAKSGVCDVRRESVGEW